MTLIRERDGRRLHVKSKLMGESLVSKSFIDELSIAPQERLFPDVNILKVGGQSICDRGVKALPAVIGEIAANKKNHKMLITTGGGTRSRHIYAIGLELGMPTGILAKFGNSISEQNALLVTMLLAPYGGIKIGHDEIVKLTSYFEQGCIPVMHGMPPYDYFAIPPEKGRIPIHRTDVGTIILADLIGAKSCIFVKDERGLYTGDPKKNADEKFIPEIGAATLIEKDQDDLIIERPCLEILQNSEVLEKISIVNGLEEGNITRALNGESVGTTIYKE
ncbi:uridine kinase [Syntrophorhabdus aromaticivorans]|jgi:molybdenum storage protein|uniref:Uridine kinase n=1 Tax=Syntrophorhabdus aromaticivorans TaxID=328301 RepID=A0A351TYV2_9BACT|nr:uridine kinase [Syntrophorhabdus aromaticivorans]NLW35504.1 uridine kinase [Syntrophorhabdus aromaticivorans]HBA52883.1 uridine kinase [Syntrophorhabdus aromaticivorans]